MARKRARISALEHPHLALFHKGSEEKTRGETAKVGGSGNSAGIPIRGCEGEEIPKEPKPKQQVCGQVDRAEQNQKPVENPDVGPRIKQEVAGEHPGNRSRSPDHWKHGLWLGESLAQGGEKAAGQVEEKVAELPHGVLHIVTKQVEEKQVSQQVKKSPVAEHGSHG